MILSLIIEKNQVSALEIVRITGNRKGDIAVRVEIARFAAVRIRIIVGAAKSFGIPAVRPEIADHAGFRLLTLGVDRNDGIGFARIGIKRFARLQREIAALAVRFNPAVAAREQHVSIGIKRGHATAEFGRKDRIPAEFERLKASIEQDFPAIVHQHARVKFTILIQYRRAEQRALVAVVGDRVNHRVLIDWRKNRSVRVQKQRERRAVIPPHVCGIALRARG